MSKPDKPEWASNNPDQVIEPDLAKKQTGWLPAEKPPNQYFNWLLLKIYEWVNWTEDKTENIEPAIIRSDNPVTWDGSSLSFTSPLIIVFRTDDYFPQTNYFETSPLTLSDGQVVVVKRNRDQVNKLLDAGTYDTLLEGEYAIVDESSLTNDDAENETILFRRRDVSASDDVYGVGFSILESPYTGQSIVGSSTFYLGGKVLSGREIINGENLVLYSDNKATETVRIDGATGNLTTVGTVDGVDVSDLANSVTTIEGEVTTLEGNVTTLQSDVSALQVQIVPIGSIIPFYDIDARLTFDKTYWAFCDGSTATISGIGAQTLPDLSNRYLVGFGTEGGNDIDTAAWDYAVVGNSSHQINLQHSHTVNAHSHSLQNHTHSTPNHAHAVNAHTHDLENHTHTGASHTHGPGSLSLKFGTYSYSSTSGGSFLLGDVSTVAGYIGVFPTTNTPTTGSATRLSVIVTPGRDINLYTDTGSRGSGTTDSG